jgi:hypothetical protein
MSIYDQSSSNWPNNYESNYELIAVMVASLFRAIDLPAWQ